MTILENDYEANPYEFFHSIITDIIPEVIKTDNERIMERYDNKLNPFNGKVSVGERLKAVNPTKISQACEYLKIKPFVNAICPNLRHLPVM